MNKEAIEALVSQMTLEEKAGLCSGADFWHTKGIERLGIPAVMVSDGPHGLRKQEAEADHLGMGSSIEAVCFPAGCLSASSFDRTLLRELGEVLGNECQAEHISVLLGPAMNIKRSPLCGRNFEYYSEDPFVSTELAAAYIEGVQSKNIGTSPKHFLANNQEHRRMTASSNMDERTMREIYLASFEGAVKKTKPWTIMGSYNRLNSIYTTEHTELLTDILRDEWGFEGVAVSDWGAVNERIAALKAGLDLEMPGSDGSNDRRIVDAVKRGELDEAVVDRACERLLDVVFRYLEHRDESAVFDRDKDHAFAKRAAEESMVLLKNEGLLPLRETSSIVFIGDYARNPRYQGGGSSHIHPSKVVSALDAAKENGNVSFAQGFVDTEVAPNELLIREAVEVAERADAAVLFVGLPERIESEGFDRADMKLPENQTALIEAVCAAQPNTAVLLHNGTPVEMPWLDQAAAVLECYLAGQAVGEAQYDILYGKVNPSGKLAETFPLRLEDNPTYPFYGMEGDQVAYREGVFVGYRYYDAKKMEVLFPFGHGLSYTSFAYSGLKVSRNTMKDTETVEVSFCVTNTGKRTGKEIVQLYVAPCNAAFARPVKELRAFDKVELIPGESREVRFCLDKRAFAYWNTALHDWHVASGEYEIQVGGSSRAIALCDTVTVESTVEVPLKITPNTIFGDIFAYPDKTQAIMGAIAGMREGNLPQQEGSQEPQPGGAMSPEMIQAMLRYMPVRSLVSFLGIPYEKMEEMLAQINS